MYREVVSLMRREYLRWIRAPTWVISGLLSPVLYLILFGQAFNLGKALPPSDVTTILLGAPNYFSYFAIGMVAFAGVTAAMFSGTGVIFDKQLGIQQRIVSTPASRGAIFSASLIFRGVLTLIPAFLVIGLALVLAYVPGLAGLTVPSGVRLLGVGEVLVAILTLSLTFTALFLAFGFSVNRVESYFGVVTILQLPILLTSNAMYPSGLMPSWLQYVVSVNPISLAVNVMRANLFGAGGYAYSPEIYLLGLIAWAVVLIGIAALLASRSFRSGVISAGRSAWSPSPGQG